MPFSPHSLQLPACTDGRERAGQAAGAAGLPGEGTHREGGHPQHPPWGPGISCPGSDGGCGIPSSLQHTGVQKPREKSAAGDLSATFGFKVSV